MLDVTSIIEESDRILVDCSRLWDDVVLKSSPRLKAGDSCL